MTALLLVLTLGPATALAQGSSDGSIYSRFGIGDLHAFGSPQIVAMGGGGTALGGARYSNFSNPASLGDLLLTGVAAGLSYESLDITDSFDNTSRLSNGSLRSIQFSFPLLSNRLGVGASFSPYSSRKYRIRVDDELETSTGEMVPYSVNFLGSGGIQQATLAFGYAVNEHLSMGLEGRLLFGLLEESRETSFDEFGYETSLLTNSVRTRGLGATFGIQGSVGGLASENDRLFAGARLSLPTTLSASEIITEGSSQERDTLSTGVEGDIELPMSFSVGIAYRASPKWLFVTDFQFEPWTDFSSEIPLPGYDAANAALLNDRTRLSAGFEVIPAGTDQLAGYLKRIGYRLGFFYDPFYLSSSADNRINTVAATAGLSLPTRFPGTRIDLNLEVGSRGAADPGLVRERFLRFGVNLNVGERWFLKTRLG